MSQIRFTDEERDAFAAEMDRVLFVQYGMKNSKGVFPRTPARAKGISRDVVIFIENMMTEKINGIPEYKARKQS